MPTVILDDEEVDVAEVLLTAAIGEDLSTTLQPFDLVLTGLGTAAASPADRSTITSRIADPSAGDALA